MPSDPFRRAVDNHVQERKREQEEIDRKRMECPHNGKIRVQEWDKVPTAYGIKVKEYLCICDICGQVRFIEGEK
jgi:hypothetical protein